MAKQLKKMHVCLVEISITSEVLEFGRRLGPGSVVDLKEKIGTVKDKDGLEVERTLGDEVDPAWFKELEVELERPAPVKSETEKTGGNK